jgi:hypothetical protein
MEHFGAVHMKFLQPATVTLEVMRTLGSDVDRMRNGQPPSKEELASAPLIEGWDVGQSWMPTIQGSPADGSNLSLPGGLLDCIWVLDERAGWVRTTLGLYRIGSRKHTKSSRSGRAMKHIIFLAESAD